MRRQRAGGIPLPSFGCAVYVKERNHKMEEFTYHFIRSKRKTMVIQVNDQGEVIVRAPMKTTRRQAEAFLARSREWIQRQREQAAQREKEKILLTQEEREQGIARAKERIPKRVAYYADRMGVNYSRITIREQKTRWGSCSSTGGLNFNWKLVLMPEEVLDYVVVHELAHRREMNHSGAFWKVVEAELPDYRERRQKLREYGERYR